MPEPSIEQIERDIQRARFKEGETEKFLTRRAARKAQALSAKRYRDNERRRAFMAGYKAALDQQEWKVGIGMIATLGVILGIFSLFQ